MVTAEPLRGRDYDHSCSGSPKHNDGCSNRARYTRNRYRLRQIGAIPKIFPSADMQANDMPMSMNLK